MNFFTEDNQSAFDAKAEAQRIAFAPVMFQACRILRDSGILELVQKSGATGMTLAEVAAKINLPRYGIKVLMESGLGIGLFCLRGGDASSPQGERAAPGAPSPPNPAGDEGVAATSERRGVAATPRFTLTKLGYFMFRDTMTRVNMDVVHEVCYRGLFDLDKAIQQGKPVGLKTLGDWQTFYEGLSSLPPKARDSWLAFDHYYSDAAFPAALKLVFADKPKRLLDVGGNTGKWAVQCARFDPDVRITIADLETAAKKQGCQIDKHDILLIHTGWLKRYYDEGLEGLFPGGQMNEPGLGYSKELVKWFHEMEIPSIGSDTIGTEQTHHQESGTMLPLHMALLHHLGVVFNEISWLDELANDCAKDGQYTFLFVGAPLKVVNAAGSPVNPVAIK